MVGAHATTSGRGVLRTPDAPRPSHRRRSRQLGSPAHDRQTSISGAANAIDDDATTRWTTATGQAAGQYFQVDLGSPTLLNRVYLDAAGFSGTAPVAYQIQVSADASTWKNVASGADTGQLTAMPFSPQVARYVRVTQTGTSANHWSIAEFNLFTDPVLHSGAHSASASVTGGGTTAGNALDGDVATRWTSGTGQAPEQSFTFDLGSTKPINKLLIDAGPTSTGQIRRVLTRQPLPPSTLPQVQARQNP